MKTHAIIPIFVPHEGCPNDCVFCNQRVITAREKAPDKAETVRIIESHLKQIGKNPGISHIEIAFYGGSFTGISMERQAEYLSIAERYKEAGRVQAIHLSTRPDYINEEILGQLAFFGIDVVELGVQSFDEEVLLQSGRGHGREAVYRSAEMIKERGIDLGIQLMVGLPGDSYEKSIASAREAVALNPAVARIYPAVVLKDTALYKMYLKGQYQPLTEADAVRTVKDMLRIFYRADIDVIRVGLKSSDNLASGGTVGGGTYHPAFRQVAESALAREDLEEMLAEQLKRIPESNQTGLRTTFYAAPESFSNMIGMKKSNKLYFAEKYPRLNQKFAVDCALPRNKYRVYVEFNGKL